MQDVDSPTAAPVDSMLRCSGPKQSEDYLDGVHWLPKTMHSEEIRQRVRRFRILCEIEDTYAELLARH